MSETYHFKLYFEGRDSIRRCSFAKELPTFARFLVTCQDLFKDEFYSDYYRFMYMDNEGDWISLSSELEWQEMLNLMCETKAFPIKLYVKKASSSARNSIPLGESMIEADVSIVELERLSQSYRPQDISASTILLSPQTSASRAGVNISYRSDETEVKRVLAESAKAFEEEQERLLQKVLAESRKAPGFAEAVTAAVTDLANKSDDLVSYLAAQGRNQMSAVEGKRQEQDRDSARLEAASSAEQERLANEKLVEEEKLRRAQKEEEERKRALELLRKEEEKKKAEEEARRREELLRRAKEIVARKQKEEEEERERKRKEEEERKKKEEEEQKKKEAQLNEEMTRKANKYAEQIFQLRSLGFEHDLSLLVALLEESDGDLVPVVDKLVST